MEAQFNFEIQPELQGIDILFSTGEHELEVLKNDKHFGLVSFGYEDNWFFMSNHSLGNIFHDDFPEFNNENIAESLIMAIKNEFDIDCEWNKYISMSKIPKMKVYYAINDDEYDIDNDEGQLSLALCTVYDYNNDDFGSFTNERLNSYMTSKYKMSEIYESIFEVDESITLNDLSYLLSNENAYFQFIENNELNE